MSSSGHEQGDILGEELVQTDDGLAAVQVQRTKYEDCRYLLYASDGELVGEHQKQARITPGAFIPHEDGRRYQVLAQGPPAESHGPGFDGYALPAK